MLPDLKRHPRWSMRASPILRRIVHDLSDNHLHTLDVHRYITLSEARVLFNWLEAGTLGQSTNYTIDKVNAATTRAPILSIARSPRVSSGLTSTIAISPTTTRDRAS